MVIILVYLDEVEVFDSEDLLGATSIVHHSSIGSNLGMIVQRASVEFGLNNIGDAAANFKLKDGKLTLDFFLMSTNCIPEYFFPTPLISSLSFHPLKSDLNSIGSAQSITLVTDVWA